MAVVLGQAEWGLHPFQLAGEIEVSLRSRGRPQNVVLSIKWLQFRFENNC
jgi:hypothetical protein